MHFITVVIFLLFPFFNEETPGNSPVNYSFEDFEEKVLACNSGDTLMIINFWATWCGPCIRELPHFEEVNRQQNQPVRVILVSLDFKDQYEQKLLPFIEKEELESELIWLNTNMNTERINRIHPDWSGAIPATLFLKNGKILNFKEKELNLEELQNTINSLL